MNKYTSTDQDWLKGENDGKTKICNHLSQDMVFKTSSYNHIQN